MTIIALDGKWKLRECYPTEYAPKVGNPWKFNKKFFLQAEVPGCVQFELMKNGLIPDFRRDLNSKLCEWTSHRDWIYTRIFQVPKKNKGKQVFLQFEGVDYACEVFLNNKSLGTHVGTFSSFNFDITRLLNFDSANTLVVRIDRAPDEEPQVGYTSKVKTTKPRFAYGWDFSTTLVPLGIWDSVFLKITGSLKIDSIRVKPKVKKSNIATIGNILEISALNEESGTVSYTITKKGKPKNIVLEEKLKITPGKGKNLIKFAYEIHEPEIWEPNGYGAHNLYQIEISVFDNKGSLSDKQKQIFGIKEIVFTKCDDSSPDSLPYSPVINGKRVFIKGWNWVPIEQLYCRGDREIIQKYKWLIRLVKEANVNLLRVWGGGLIEKEIFYELCDEYGIMVWQEFPLSSSALNNQPSEDEEFLEFLKGEAINIIKKTRNHVSHVLWCGGNELTKTIYDKKTKKYEPIPIGYDEKANIVLSNAIEKFDKGKFFLPTSPSGGSTIPKVELAGTGKLQDVHSPWEYMGKEAHYKFYNTIDPLLYSEFGCEGAGNVETIREYISPDRIWPPDETNPSWIHHGLCWINRKRIEDLFGQINDIQSFVRASQFIQAEGLRYAVEENRRKKFHNTGTIPWQFNESWPTTSCTSSVDYNGLPKMAYYFVRKAYEPVHISLRYPKIVFKKGEKFNAEIWINSNKNTECRWQVMVVNIKGEPLLTFNDKSRIFAKAQKNKDLRWKIATDDYFIVRLVIEPTNGKSITNDYVFSSIPRYPFKKLLELTKTPNIHWGKRANDTMAIKNNGDEISFFVNIYDILQYEKYNGPILEDNFFNLFPGEETKIKYKKIASR